MEKFENLKPNSHKYKEQQNAVEERKKVEKVVTGPVKVKKNAGVKKLSDFFISEDAANVKSYLVMDVLLPAIKNTIEDIVINGVRMILRGDTTDRRGNRSSGYRADIVSYNKLYDRHDRRYESDTRTTRTGYSYDDVILPTRGEAEEVLARMDELIESYGQVAVADLYDLVGISGNYTDNKYGWTNIRNAEPVRVRDGYILKLPKVTTLNN